MSFPFFSMPAESTDQTIYYDPPPTVDPTQYSTPAGPPDPRSPVLGVLIIFGLIFLLVE